MINFVSCSNDVEANFNGICTFQEGQGDSKIKLRRESGDTGSIKIRWVAIEHTATHGDDYCYSQGDIEFSEGEVSEKVKQLVYNINCSQH